MKTVVILAGPPGLWRTTAEHYLQQGGYEVTVDDEDSPGSDNSGVVVLCWLPDERAGRDWRPRLSEWADAGRLVLGVGFDGPELLLWARERGVPTSRTINGTADLAREFGTIRSSRPTEAVLMHWGDGAIALVCACRAYAPTPCEWTLPSGIDSFEHAVGFTLSPERLRDHGGATRSRHGCRLFSVQGTPEELDSLRSREGTGARSQGPDGYTFPWVVPRKELAGLPLDWATLGMVLFALSAIDASAPELQDRRPESPAPDLSQRGEAHE